VIAELRSELRLLPHVIAYEYRKATAFRLGFLLTQIGRGVTRQVVMAAVFYAMFQSSGRETFNGYRFPDLIAYLVWTAAVNKCLSHEGTLDLAEQIFDGYITKYLVMPISVFTLVAGRFVQYTSVQLLASTAFWIAGALLVPAYWPYPPSALAFAQALVLVLLGAACYMLVHFILCCLAFWFDVVWSLLAMFRFVAIFASGALLPVALMPEAFQHGLALLFPYWTVFTPAELLIGRAGTPQFLHGAAALTLWLLGLSALAALTFRRGVARYSGVGT
jgi:ABC-2 type transport system permease protein